MDYDEKEEHLRMTGTNEHIFVETHPCDLDLAKISQMGSTWAQHTTKKVPLTTPLNLLFTLNNENDIGFKNIIFLTKNSTSLQWKWF